MEDIRRQLTVATSDSAIVELTTDLGFAVSDNDQQQAMQYFLAAEARSKKSRLQARYAQRISRQRFPDG